MSKLLEDFRNEFPEDPRSDFELTGYLGEKLEARGDDIAAIDPDFAAEYDDYRKAFYPSLGTEVKRGFKRGVAQTASTLWAGAALAADTADVMAGDRDTGLDFIEKARDRAMESYENERQVADRNAPSIRSYRDVGDFSDGLRFITGLGGEVAPSAAMSIASGGTAGVATNVIGKRVAKRAIAKNISRKYGAGRLKKEIKDSAGNAIPVNALARQRLTRRATAKATRRATGLGVGASSVLQNAGETYGELYDTAASRGDRIGASLLAGMIAGALEAAVPIAVLRRVFPAKAVKDLGDEALKKTAIRQMEDKIDKAFEGYSSLKRKFFTVMAKDTSNEAWTEAAQEAIQEAAQAYADPDYQFDADAFRERLINASIAGAVGGAQFGGASAVSETYRQAGTNRNLREVGKKWNEAISEDRTAGRANAFGFDEKGDFDREKILRQFNRINRPNDESLLRPIYEGEGVEFNTDGDIDPSEGGMPLFNEDGSFNFARTQGPGIPESLSKELTDLVNFAQRESAKTGTGPVRALLTYIDPQNEFHSVEIRGESLEAIERQAKERGARKVQVSQIGADPQGQQQAEGDQDQAPLEDITAEERETAEAMLELADFDFSDAELREQAVSNLVREQRERRGAAANEQEEESLETTEAVRAAEQEEIEAIEGLDLDAELKAELTAQVRESANERIEELDDAAGVREWTLTDAEGDSITVRADSEMEAFAAAAQQNFEPVEATSKKARKRIEDFKRVPVPQKRISAMTEEELFSKGMQDWDKFGNATARLKAGDRIFDIAGKRGQDIYNAGWQKARDEGRANRDNPTVTDRARETGLTEEQFREQNPELSAEVDRRTQTEPSSEQAQQPEAAQQRESVETTTTTTDPFVASEGFSFYDTDSITQIYGDTEAGIAKESAYGRAKFNESGEQASSKKTTRRALAIRDRSTGVVTVRGVYNNGNGVFVHKPSGQGENITKALGANQEVIGIVEFDAGGAPLTESETSKLEKLADKPREDYTNADRNLLKGLAKKKYGFTNIYHEMPEAEFLSITEGRVSDPRESFEQKLERGSIQSVRPGEGIENMITFSDDGEIQTVEDEGDGSVEIGGERLSEAEVSETFDTAALVTDDVSYSGDEDARELVLEALRDEIGMPSPEVETLLSRVESGTAIEIEELLEDEELLPVYTANVEESGLRKAALSAHLDRAVVLIQQLHEYDTTVSQRVQSRTQRREQAGPREADSTVSGVSGTGRQSGRAQGQAPATPGRGRRERPDDATATTAGDTAPELSQRASGRSDGSEAGDRGGTESGEPASRRLDWQPLEDGYVAYAGAISLGVRGSGREWEVRILIDDEPAFAETFIGEPEAAMLYAEQQATQQILEAEEAVDGAEELVDETVDAEGGPLTTEQLTRAIEEEGQDGRVTVYFPEGEYDIAGETQTFDDPDDPDAENILEAQRKPQRSIEGYRVRFSKRDWVLEGYPADDGSTLFYATYLDDDEQHGGKSNATPPSTGSSGGGGSSSSGSTTPSTGQEESVESAAQPEGAPTDKPPMRTIKGNQVPKVTDRIKGTYDVDAVGKLGVNLALDQFEARRPGFILADGTGIGKELHVDEPILTEKGWRPIGEVRPGEKVFGRDGQLHNVTAYYPQGKKPLYRITFSDGGSVRAGLEHQWAVRSENDRARGNPWRVITTEDLLDGKDELDVSDTSRQKRVRKWSIPLNDPIDFKGKKDFVIPPYVMGTLLGDGALKHGFRLVPGDERVAKKVEASLPPDYSLTTGADYGTSTAYYIKYKNGQRNPMRNYIRSAGLEVTGDYKFIPDDYLYADIESRHELLAGLLDTDGSYSGARVRYSSTSLRLAEDIQELARSLGYLSSLTPVESKKPNEQTCFVVAISNFDASRSGVKSGQQAKETKHRLIESIKYECTEEAACIAVDAPDALYITKDYIVTHNTRQALASLDYIQRAGDGAPVLYVTQNKPLIKKVKGEMATMNIVNPKVEFYTYTDIERGKLKDRRYGAVAFDEAHNLKDHTAKKTINSRPLINESPFVMFITATPMDRVEAAAYFIAKVTGEDPETIFNRIGLTQVEKTRKDDSTYTVIQRLKGVTDGHISMQLKALSDNLISRGAMVRREYPFYGTRDVIELEMTEQMQQEELDIIAHWQSQVGEGGASTFGYHQKGQMLQELNRWIEAKKVDAIYQHLKDDLAAGRQVVVFGETKGPQKIKGLGESRPGLLQLLGERLEQDGIEFSKLYSAKKGERAIDVGQQANLFQDGKTRVALATPQSGGTGIDLDDQVGSTPRSAYIATMNFSGDVFEQIMGRFTRRNTQSPTELHFVAFPDAESEAHRAEVLQRKLDVLSTIQGKEFQEDPVADLFTEEDISSLGAPDIAPARITSDESTIATHNHVARPQGRIDSANGIDYEIQRIDEAINTPFKADILVNQISEAFGAGAESRVFIRRILESIPGEKLQTLNVEFFEDESFGPGEYLPASATIRLNRAHTINDGDGVAMVFTHEAGHFFAEEIVGRETVMNEWQSLTDEQRQAAWAQYAKVNSTKAANADPEVLFNSAEAAHEWAAMQFHRIAAAGKEGRRAVTSSMKKEGIKQGLIDRIIAWVDQLRDWFKGWIGDPNLSTRALDEAFTTALGAEYVRKDHAQQQGEFLLQRAFASGYDSVETFAIEAPAQFAKAAKEWRSGVRLDSPDTILENEITPEEKALQRLPRAGNSAANQALDDARRKIRSDSKAKRADGEQSLDDQLRSLIEWSNQNNRVLSDRVFFEKWKQQVERDKKAGVKKDDLGGGSEHLVYFEPDTDRWTKRNTLTYHNTVDSLLRRIDAHNRLFPEAPLSFGGIITGNLDQYDQYLPGIGEMWSKFLDDDANIAQVVVRQRHVNATAKLTPEQLRKDMERRGFKGVVPAGFANNDGAQLWKYAKPDESVMRYYHPDYAVYLHDLHKMNVASEGGKVAVIDPIITFADTAEQKPVDEGERFGSPDTVLRNKDIRKRIDKAKMKNKRERTAAIAPEVTGRVEEGKRIVLENAWTTHDELNRIAFPLYNKLREQGRFDGTYEEFYREYTDTPITPKEAKTYLDNFDIEYDQMSRSDLDADRRRNVDDYLLYESFETVGKLDKRIDSNTGARDAALKEVDKLKNKRETYQKKFNDASALEAEALAELRQMLSHFERALGAKGGAAKLGRLGEVIRQLEGKEQLDNRIARKYLLGIERLIASERFSVFDLLERASKLDIDYKKPAHKIRKQLKEEGVDSLEELSDSEFAAMLALARADRHLIDTIVLRKIPEAKEKLAIVESEVAETRGDVDRARKATNNIKKYSAFKGRIAGHRAAITAKISRREKQIKKFEEQISVSRVALDHFGEQLNKALGRVGATTRGEIVEGTGLFVPESEKSTRSDIEGSMTNFSYENTTQADMTRILAAQKRWLDGPQAEELKRTDPLFYAQVLTQSIRITERTFKEVKEKSTSLSRGIYFDSLASSFDKTNTRAGKTLAQMLQRVEAQSQAWRNEATALGEKSDKARVRLGKALGFDNRPDLFSRQFTDVIDTPMKSYMEQPGATIRGFVRERLNNKVDARLVESYYDAEVANAKFIGRVISHGMNQAGLGAVTNDRILVPDYANGGRLTPLEQLHRNVGTNTFLIRPRLDELSSIVHLADKGDFATPKEIRDLLKEMGENDMEPAAIDDAVNYLFRDNTAFDMLVGALARKDKVPVFVDSDGELVERSDAMSAWNEAKTPSAFFRLLGGDMAENLGTVAELYNEVANAVKENENRKNNSRDGVDKGDAPAIHARKADVWPSEWLAYRQGGATANHILVNEGILAAVFGKSRERIDAERQSLVQELRRKRNDAVLAKDQKTVAEYDDQISKIDGKNGLFDQLNQILGSQLGPLKDLRLGMELLGTGVGGVLNGPRAALVQLNQVYQTLLKFGISKTTLRMSATQVRTIMQDLLGSFFEAMGITLFRESEAFRLQKELFGLEPEKLNDFWDFTGDMGNEGNIGVAQRRVRQFNNLVFRRGLSRADAKDALYSSFKPWAPFSQLIGALHKAPMVAFRGEFDRFAAKAIQSARGKDPSKVKFSAKEMGYSDLEFDRLNGILESRVGLTLADVVARHEASNSKQAPYTNDEYRIISSVGLDLLASESNVFTTRSPQMHTAMGRWVFPLLGWAIQQPHNAANMFKGGEGEVTRRTLTSGILTVGFGLMPAVMAMAMFEDWFDEYIMGKKRNLRPVMTEDDSISSTAILERITRSGMLGMPMEIVNLGVNGVGGGDMRTASLDQRVFLANSIRSAVQLAGNVYAQKDFTWNDGIRLGQLAGMNGALQQFDMFNNVLGLEGAGIEPLQVASRRTARINASNYLKVGGRMVGLELKNFSGSIRPTPVTPWVTRMQLAAMGGDTGDFQAAYKKALDAARDHMDMTGPREAEEYIARSWNSRHPLKGPFKTSPTPEQLNRLLGAIGERGARDVTEMLSAYNSFGQRIGARAYHGKESNRGRSRNKGVATMANITGIGL